MQQLKALMQEQRQETDALRPFMQSIHDTVAHMTPQTQFMECESGQRQLRTQLEEVQKQLAELRQGVAPSRSVPRPSSRSKRLSVNSAAQTRGEAERVCKSPAQTHEVQSVCKSQAAQSCKDRQESSEKRELAADHSDFRLDPSWPSSEGWQRFDNLDGLHVAYVVGSRQHRQESADVDNPCCQHLVDDADLAAEKELRDATALMAVLPDAAEVVAEISPRCARGALPPQSCRHTSPREGAGARVSSPLSVASADPLLIAFADIAARDPLGHTAFAEAELDALHERLHSAATTSIGAPSQEVPLNARASFGPECDAKQCAPQLWPRVF